MTPDKLANLVRGKVEGFIPDLCDGLETDKERHDALQDFVGDWLYDRYRDGVPAIIRKKTAEKLATEYFGDHNG